MSSYQRQALQIAITAVIAVLLYRLFDLQNGYWVVLTAIFVMQSSLGASLQRARLRLAGTLSGVVLGALFCVLFPHHMWLFYSMVAISILFTVYLFPFSYAGCMLFGSFLVVVLLAYHSGDAWQFASTRLLDTVIGVLIAGIVSWLVLSRPASQLHFCTLITSLQACEKYFNSIIESFFSQQYDRDLLEKRQEQLENSLQDGQKHYDDLHYEPSVLYSQHYITGSILRLQERMQGVLLSMRFSAHDSQLDDQAVRAQCYAITQVISQQFQQLVIAAEKKQALDDIENLYKVNQQLQQQLQQWHQTNSADNIAMMNVKLFFSSMRRLVDDLMHLQQALIQLQQLNVQ